MYLKRAKEKKTEIIEDTISLIKIQSIRDDQKKSKEAPFGPEIKKALDWILNKAKEDGFKTEDVDGYAGVISYGDGEESVAMLGHLDVVPVGNDWTKDPFGGEIEDGFIYGRGATDDKGPTIAAYHALKMIKEMNVPLKRKIMLIVGTDEESGMECMEYFKKHYTPQPTMGFVPDADFPAIYGEKGLLILKVLGQQETVMKRMSAGQRPNIVIGQASCEVLGELKEELFTIYLKQNNLDGFCESKGTMARYTIIGNSYHASMPHRGVNAANHLFKFIGGAYNDKTALALGNLLSDPFGQGLNIYFKGSHMGELTLNTGIVHIDENQIDITLDIRYPHDVTAVEIYDKAQAALQLKIPGLSVTLCGQSEPLFVDPNSELVTSCMESYREISGDELTPAQTMGGGTYARVLENHIAFGPIFPNREFAETVGGPHEKDEGIEIETLVEACAIYANTLHKLAG